MADARCLQVLRDPGGPVRWQDGAATLEDEGELRAHLLGCGEERAARWPPLGAPVAGRQRRRRQPAPGLGRVARPCPRPSTTPSRGALVLVDGDLQPDWRIPPTWLAELLDRADAPGRDPGRASPSTRRCPGAAPRCSASSSGRPSAALGPRAMWWAPVAPTRPDVGPGLQVVVARLDPDARFSFRVDLPAGADPAAALGRHRRPVRRRRLPRLPLPLTVADRLAACPGWVRDDVWDRIAGRLRPGRRRRSTSGSGPSPTATG